MTPMTLTMERDQTAVHAQKVPVPDLHVWTYPDPSEFLPTEADEDAPPVSGSESLQHERATHGQEEDSSRVKRSSASTGVETLSALAIGGARPYSPRPQLDHDAVLILRATYLGAVLDSLEAMQPHAQTPRVARYAGEMLDASTLYADRVPDDPIVGVVLAVYPALADENHWADWSADQLRDLHRILQDLAKQRSVTPKMVDKALTRIEERVGLDTLPFEIDPRQIS